MPEIIHSKINFHALAQSLHDWYLLKKRQLPWRDNRAAYRIWISEIMLQQTTVQAVIPYFERFIIRFPDLQTLANSDIEEVLQLWSGLGYYSRARNLHKAAQLFVENGGIPSTFQELLKYPGLGDYTSRAISSIAFDEKVGVLDGNVIRILTRLLNYQQEWWKTEHKKYLQGVADSLNQFEFPSSEINQALMELGATVCLPQSPLCNQCPWSDNCLAQSQKSISEVPLKRKKTPNQIWYWQPEIYTQKNQVLLEKNTKLPFLKNQWLLPGKCSKQEDRPQNYDLKHFITHYNIYVKIKRHESAKALRLYSNQQWFDIDEIKHVNPSSLLSKCFSNSAAKSK